MPEIKAADQTDSEAVIKWVKEQTEALAPGNDNVHRPAHYTKGGIECIQAIEASMSKDAFRGYLKGNIIKYVFRYEQKGYIESLEKARVYLDWLIKHLNENES